MPQTLSMNGWLSKKNLRRISTLKMVSRPFHLKNTKKRKKPSFFQKPQKSKKPCFQGQKDDFMDSLVTIIARQHELKSLNLSKYTSLMHRKIKSAKLCLTALLIAWSKQNVIFNFEERKFFCEACSRKVRTFLKIYFQPGRPSDDSSFKWSCREPSPFRDGDPEVKLDLT